LTVVDQPSSEEIRRLVDERAIERLLVRYCRLVDDGHSPQVAELFEADASLDLMGREAVGRDAIAQVFAAAGGPVDRPSTSHALSNAVIDVDGSSATATTDLTVVSRTAEGTFAVTLAARYHDELRRTDRWRFVSRRVVVHARSPT
jgi:3-phenylpropionate/cinnamic acid dioxygenase small subunit